MDSPILTYKDYTIGWICALSGELLAARAVLEEEHPSLRQPQRDQNSYTLGRIGKHNIVIACLPSGKYGTTSAANVAKDLFRTFTSIRFGLMVGIGGGAPNQRHDIRLGDVVVSSPTGRSSAGVMNYDAGKVIQDEKFLHTSSLIAPPTALLTALQRLKTDHILIGHRIKDAVHEMHQRNPRLKNECKRPKANEDRLYAAGYVHSDTNQPCDNVCDDARLITRKPRDEDEDDPAIHYGLIASADKLMKDARFRDSLANEHDILCFEMEAAGLMDNFPCLVIRGICDYSDTHKNDQWQGHAAVTAAAYAKELLEIIPEEDVDRTKPVTNTSPQDSVFTVPFDQDRQFIGRQDIIDLIDKSFQMQYRIALSGWGGMG
jgi:nucleoside phosphorylase